jgi:hypothetical protein
MAGARSGTVAGWRHDASEGSSAAGSGSGAVRVVLYPAGDGEEAVECCYPHQIAVWQRSSPVRSPAALAVTARRLRAAGRS